MLLTSTPPSPVLRLPSPNPSPPPRRPGPVPPRGGGTLPRIDPEASTRRGHSSDRHRRDSQYDHPIFHRPAVASPRDRIFPWPCCRLWLFHRLWLSPPFLPSPRPP